MILSPTTRSSFEPSMQTKEMLLERPRNSKDNGRLDLASSKNLSLLQQLVLNLMLLVDRYRMIDAARLHKAKNEGAFRDVVLEPGADGAIWRVLQVCEVWSVLAAGKCVFVPVPRQCKFRLTIVPDGGHILPALYAMVSSGAMKKSSPLSHLDNVFYQCLQARRKKRRTEPSYTRRRAASRMPISP